MGHKGAMKVIAGRYRLILLISEGGFGSVYLAEQMSLRREVVIKLLKQEALSNDILRERFRREALMISRFSHPNIITYHDSGFDEEGKPFLVMEYLRGETLSSYLRRKFPLPLGEIVRLISDVASGLAYSHRNGVIHRDVKPSNIFIVAQEEGGHYAKLFDFGIAAVKKIPHEIQNSSEFATLTRRGYIIGTPEYLAPEILKGHEFDAMVDQYALAVVAYEMIAGRRLFAGENKLEVFMRQAGYTPPPLNALPTGRKIPDRLDAAILKALSKNPSERFDCMERFREEIESSMRGFDKRAYEGRTVVSIAGEGERTVTSTRIEGGKRWKAIAAIFCAFMFAVAVVAGLAYFTDETEVDDAVSSLERSGPEGLKVSERRPGPLPVPDRVFSPAPVIGSDSIPKKGRITVNAQPWGDVYVDGKFAGRTPLLDYEVLQGVRKITVENPALGSQTRFVTVKPGRKQTLKFTFRKTEY